MNQTRVLVEGLGLPESTRWHDGCVWVCNWGTGEVLAVTSGGDCKTAARIGAQTIPFSIDWLPDGRMLVIDGPRQLLLAQSPDGKLDTLADLTNFGAAPFNELVVDAAGNAYVNGGPGAVVRVEPDGSARQVADRLQWPNGMALIDDDQTADHRHAAQTGPASVAARASLTRRRQPR